MVLLAAPVLAATLALGALAVPGPLAAPGIAPLADPVPIALPVSVQLSLVASPAYAETSTQVQATVTTRLGSGPAGTVNFSVEGTGTYVGSSVDTVTHTAIAKIGLFTTGPITVDANFVPNGGSAVTASATQKFQIVGMLTRLSVFVPSPAAAGSTVPFSVTINTDGQPYPAEGHMDVFVDSSVTRAGYCVPAPNPLGLGYPCKGTIPAPAAGAHTLHLVFDDSPYYAGSVSGPLVVRAPAATATTPLPAKSAGGSASSDAAFNTAPTAAPTSTATASADAAGAADTPAAEPAADSQPSRGPVHAPIWLWPLLMLVALLTAAGIALIVVLRRRRRSGAVDAPLASSN